MPGIWSDAKAAFRKMNAGEEFATRSEAWRRQTARIALLEDEVGKELDALGVNFTDARRVAYGISRIDQRRRLDALKKRRALRLLPRALRTKAAPKRGQQLCLRIVLEVPEHLAKTPKKKLRALAIAGLLPALKKLGFCLATEEHK
jgi:hypothetical protein